MIFLKILFRICGIVAVKRKVHIIQEHGHTADLLESVGGLQGYTDKCTYAPK
jgi:hypothetical protein